jgi:phospholipid/cholesterol/gamma-HCH transport system substrate-binding protein
MNPISHRQSVLLGLFVSIALGLVVLGLFSIGTIEDLVTPEITVASSFPQVDGLTRGAAVWYSGVKVGTVDELSLTPEGTVDVTLNIRADAAPSIPADTVASISSDGLIGNTIVALGPGTSAERLTDGSVVPSTSSVGTDQLMADLKTTNDNLIAITDDLKAITGRVAHGEGSVARILRDDALYTDLASTLDNLDAASADARRTAAGTASFAATLDDPDALPRQIATDTTTWPLVRESVIDGRASVQRLQSTVDRVADGLAAEDTPVGLLLGDEEAGRDLASTFATLDRSALLLEEDLEAVQHNFLLRRYFKKKAKREEKAKEEANQGE